jgi:tRNA nucleotidyltransferase/poly(A) polymerase
MENKKIRLEVRKILMESKMKESNEIRLKKTIPVPSDILQIKDIFKKNGFKLYVVGGAVRDALLGKTPKDYDLATDAVPDKVEEMMKASGLRTLPTGKAFGVINVFTSEGEYEIATFRRDLSGGRRPDAVEFTDIAGDVKRRDLTINALFYDIDTGEVVDLVGGIEDLNKGIVRTVGSAEERFGEDRLRILRAIRFAGRFGSNLDPAVDAALQKDSSLEGVSGERIRDEFLKGIKSAKSVKHFLELIQRYNLFHWIFGSLIVKEKGMQSLDLIEERDIPVLLAYLLVDNNLDVIKKELNVLKYSSLEISQIYFLISLKDLTADNAIKLKKSQSNSGVNNDQIRNFGSRIGLPSQLLDAFEEFKFTVKSQDLMDSGFSGKELGEEKDRLEKENFWKLLNNL